MTGHASISLLWVDDQIAGYGSWVAALEAQGFAVTTAASTGDALKAAATTSFDVALVDMLMPEPDGIECLRRLNKLHPGMPLAALSSYLYLDRFVVALQTLGFGVELIDKDMPPTTADDFAERFLLPIRAVAEHGVRNTIESVQAKVDAEGDDPFEITLQDFQRQSILEKDRMVLRARQLARDVIEKAFREGNVWVFLCGGTQPIRAAAKEQASVQSEEEVMEFARSQNRAPYQFWKPLDVEDVGWSSCDTMGRYPTVTLEFGQVDITVHFDTGAPVTFFSYEELLRIGAMQPTNQFGLAARAGVNYFAANLDLETVIKSQGEGTSTRVALRGQAVRDWLSSPYGRRCDENCQIQPLGLLCRDRQALVGRNLLHENSLQLLLDGVDMTTKLRGQ